MGHLLLIHCEGNGDFLQMGRYVKLARARCDRLTLVVEHQLQSLAKRSLAADDVIEFRDMRFPFLQQADAYSVVNLCLAGTLGVEVVAPMLIEPVPETVPHLDGGLHVGLCWAASGAVRADNGRERSIPFAAFTQLRSIPNARFHSLQVGAFADQAPEWVQRHELKTYDDTTSLIAALDAVVSVDTSVCHLAANIGKPVYLILTKRLQDARWGTGGTTSWYPTMRIYRRNPANAMKAIAENIAAEQGS